MQGNIIIGESGNSSVAFSFANSDRSIDTTRKNLVEDIIFLTKLACYSDYRNGVMGDKFESVNTAHLENYSKFNSGAKNSILEYVMHRVNPGVNIYTDPDKEIYLDDTKANKVMFAIITEVLDTINSDNEMEAALLFANIKPCSKENSANFTLSSKALYAIQRSSYMTNASRTNRSYASSINVTPESWKCAVAMSLMHMVQPGYDFGREMAKLVMSYRTELYAQVINTIFNQTSLILSPFYMNTFAQSDYISKTELLKAANGGVDVAAYGTLTAFNAIAQTLDGFQIKDELVKTAIVRNLFGVTTNIISQSVNTVSNSTAGLSTLTFDARVPENKIIVMSNIPGDRPVKIAHAETTKVIYHDGRTTSGIDQQSYMIEQGWGLKLATQGNIMLVNV